jgi:hypothetical protein
LCSAPFCQNFIQKPGFSASNKPCQANIRSNFGKFNSSDTKNLVSWLRRLEEWICQPSSLPTKKATPVISTLASLDSRLSEFLF